MRGGNKIEGNDAGVGRSDYAVENNGRRAGPHARFCLWSVTRFIREILVNNYAQ